MRHGIVFAVMVVASWFLFGPLGGFHHMYSFGLLRYMFINGEDPDARGYIIEGWGEVALSVPRLAISLVAWILVLRVTILATSPKAIAWMKSEIPPHAG